MTNDLWPLLAQYLAGLLIVSWLGWAATAAYCRRKTRTALPPSNVVPMTHTDRMNLVYWRLKYQDLASRSYVRNAKGRMEKFVE